MILLNPEEGQALLWLLIGGISAWGGLVNYILNKKSPDNKIKSSDIISNILISSFAGLMGGLISSEIGLTEHMTLIMSGLFGSMGGSVILILQNLVSKHLR
ncbi:hypothetical protein HA48_04820 [Pantoea wallisii]|uniref:Holin n=1 Tax=Pantoea wallisii TaxID=1076551 RepID=A0A1X1DCH7_9GAMM|nr:phage holin family protein [Pantoea wallisii]ORM74392.1 hypothetical protein HA48_04820 [Pantoea wallisii]